MGYDMEISILRFFLVIVYYSSSPDRKCISYILFSNTIAVSSCTIGLQPVGSVASVLGSALALYMSAHCIPYNYENVLLKFFSSQLCVNKI